MTQARSMRHPVRMKLVRNDQLDKLIDHYMTQGIKKENKIKKVEKNEGGVPMV